MLLLEPWVPQPLNSMSRELRVNNASTRRAGDLWCRVACPRGVVVLRVANIVTSSLIRKGTFEKKSPLQQPWFSSFPVERADLTGNEALRTLRMLTTRGMRLQSSSSLNGQGS